MFGKSLSPVRADDGNRTRMTSLEGWGSTIELHPRDARFGAPSVAYRLGAAGKKRSPASVCPACPHLPAAVAGTADRGAPAPRLR